MKTNEEYRKIIITLESGREIEFDPEFYNENKLVDRLNAGKDKVKTIRRVSKR